MTQEELQSLVRYEPKTGLFYWNKTRRGCKIGKTCGSINGGGYIEIKLNNKRYLAHRLVFLYVEGILPYGEVDHINHDKTDNIFCNLRIVDKLQNARNQKLHKTSSSGVCGVRFRKTRNRWVAEININGKSIHIGSFLTKEEAIKARVMKEKELGFHTNHGT